jgi:chromosome segregation ATPase
MLIKKTGITDVNEFIKKFLEKDESLETLKDQKQQNETKLMQLTDKRQNLKDELKKMNGDGSEAMTSK